MRKDEHKKINQGECSSMNKNKTKDIARISDRGDVVQKTALNYFKELKDEEGIVYSIDMIRIKFKIKAPDLVEKIMADIRDKSIYYTPTPYECEYVERKKWFMYRHNFNIKVDEGKSFYIAFSMNCDDKAKQCEGVMEFNPNKLFGVKEICFKRKYINEDGIADVDLIFQGDIMNYFLRYLIANNSKWIKLARYDLAIDIPCRREQVWLLKDNRTYSLYAPSQNVNTHTEYLGKHQKSGFVKIYNKTIESDLNKDVTRVEITSEHRDYKKFMSQFPKVFMKGNSTLKPYIALKGTDLVLYELLMKEENKMLYFKRLGRDKQSKLKDYIFADEEDKQIAITETIFTELMNNIKDYCSLKELVIST